MNLTKMQLNKDTLKFWSFKDTKRHKSLSSKKIKPNVIRIFKFKTSFLLEIHSKNTDNVDFVIPLRFSSNLWPKGMYTGLSGKGRITFLDKDILRVIN